MLFVILCQDKENHQKIRQENRDKHVQFLQNLAGRLKLAGPFLNAQQEMIGSMLIVEAEDLEAVQTLVAEDPYAQAELFAQVEIKAWRYVCGEGF